MIGANASGSRGSKGCNPDSSVEAQEMQIKNENSQSKGRCYDLGRGSVLFFAGAEVRTVHHVVADIR